MIRIFLLIVFLGNTAAAAVHDRQAWVAWRTEREEETRDGEKSFLNLQDAVWVKLRKKVWLPADGNPKNLHFARSLPDFVGLSVFFDGKRALLSQGTTTFDLLQKKKWMIPGGLSVNSLIDQGDLRLYLRNPQADAVGAFKKFEFFDFNPSAVITGTFKPRAKPKRHVFSTSTGRDSKAWFLGVVEFQMYGEDHSVKAYSFEDDANDSSYLFLPFLDQTSRTESYGGGRYLDADIKNATKKSSVTLDFNRAYNPLCARSKFYSCPLVPDKPISVAIKAGEKRPLSH